MKILKLKCRLTVNFIVKEILEIENSNILEVKREKRFIFGYYPYTRNKIDDDIIYFNYDFISEYKIATKLYMRFKSKIDKFNRNKRILEILD